MNKTKNYYNYSSNFFNEILDRFDYASPLQIELQPGIHCDLYRCPYCYGHGQKQIKGNTPSENYLKAIREVHQSNPTIQIAGISTEPTTYKEFPNLIRGIKEMGLVCGLHTKGYRLKDEIASEYLKPSKDNSECFITFSLDSSNKKHYLDLHDIADRKDKLGNHADNYFDIVIKNIKHLYLEKKRLGINLRINITYLLFQENSTDASIDEAIDLIYEYCDSLRFTIPQSRNDGIINNNYISNNKKSYLYDLKEKMTKYNKIRVLEDTYQNNHETSFKKCYAQMFQAVIDKAGYVFPCPQTALKNYEWLQFGNINEKSFLEILQSMERKKLFEADVDKELKCRICDRKDEKVNMDFDKIINA